MANYTAIVSGGNTGIGAAIARGLLAEGYEVISLSRRKPDWSHPKLSACEVDLLDRKRAILENFRERFALNKFHRQIVTLNDRIERKNEVSDYHFVMQAI